MVALTQQERFQAGVSARDEVCQGGTELDLLRGGNDRNRGQGRPQRPPQGVLQGLNSVSRAERR